MTEDLTTALMVLVVGMTTVFVILFLVVLTGNTLIRVVNRFSPITTTTLDKTPIIASPSKKTTESFDGAKLAAIVSAVQIVTKGQASIQKIEKITSHGKGN